MVQRILQATKSDIRVLLGNAAALGRLRAGEPSSMRVSASRPCATSSPSWRSPGAIRGPHSRPRSFQDGVETIGDLEPGMQLEGVVTNVAAFGAFVDIGVHQDGLVHISAMARRRIASPAEVVRIGEVVRVLVLSVDVPRKRIALSMRLDDPVEPAAAPRGAPDQLPAGRPEARRRRMRNPRRRARSRTPSGGRPPRRPGRS